MTTDISDKSLLRCTYKKSMQVLERVVLYLAIIIDGIAAITVGAWGAFTGGMLVHNFWESSKIPNSIWNLLYSVWGFIAGLVSLVPWWVWVIVAGAVSIVGYSFLWCVRRELGEADYVSCLNLAAHIGCVVGGIFGVGFQVAYISRIIPRFENDASVLFGGLVIPVIILLGVIGCGVLYSQLVYPMYHHYILAPRKAKQEKVIKEMP